MYAEWFKTCIYQSLTVALFVRQITKKKIIVKKKIPLFSAVHSFKEPTWSVSKLKVSPWKHSVIFIPLHLFFLWKWPHFWLIKHQFACLPAMIVLLSPLHPSSALYSNTLRSLHSQQQAAALTMPCCVCLHSVISLLTVGMLSVFVSPFSFFHAQHYAEEVLCIPCQFQYVPPAHSCLAFTLASLLFLLIFSPHSLATLDWFWVL